MLCGACNSGNLSTSTTCSSLPFVDVPQSAYCQIRYTYTYIIMLPLFTETTMCSVNQQNNCIHNTTET